MLSMAKLGGSAAAAAAAAAGAEAAAAAGTARGLEPGGLPTATWRVCAAAGRAVTPVARAGHALVSFSNRLYLFGGYCDVVSWQLANERTATSASAGRRRTGIEEEHVLEILEMVGDGGEGPGETVGPERNVGVVPRHHPHHHHHHVHHHHHHHHHDVTGGRRCPHLNSVEEYHIVKGVWKVLSSDSGDAAGPRYPIGRRHASMVVHGGCLYIYGGFTALDETLNDLWEFNILAKRWRRVAVAQGVGRLIPGARAEHTSVVYGNKMIVFGGYDGKKKLNDTFVFDFVSKTWAKPKAAEINPPNRRCKHSAVRYGNLMYVLGGFQYNDGDNYACTDMHMLDLDTYTWSTVLMSGVPPDSLQGHRAAVCGDSMYVIGGKVRADEHGGRTSGLNTTVWVYRLDLDRWTGLSVVGQCPIPRQLHAITVIGDHAGRKKKTSIYMFGGTDKAKTNFYDDLIELQGLSGALQEETKSCAACDSMGILLKNELFSDVQFKLDDGTIIHGHRCVLYARSDYFRKMFGGKMLESTMQQIDITGVAKQVFEAVLEYLYTGKLEIDDGQLAVDVLKAADMFSMDDLRRLCVKCVEQAVTTENVAYICELADTHNSEQLKTYCMTYIMQNFKEVIASESWLNLMRREPGGLGKDILDAYADFNPAPYKRQRYLK